MSTLVTKPGEVNLGMVLSREQQKQYLARISPKEDRDDWRFDGRLFDAVQQLGYPDQMISEVRKSIKDRNCSKQFYHKEAMMENANRFLGPQTKDARYTKPCRAARVLLAKILPKRRLQKINVEQLTEDDLSNKSGAAGAIGYGSKVENFERCQATAKQILKLIHDGANFKDVQIPTMCYHRGQLGHLTEDGVHYSYAPKKKDRFVIGVDGGTVLIEMQYGKPLYQLLKNHAKFYAGGKSPEDLRKCVKRGRGNRLYWFSTDYSHFDQSVPAWVLWEVFNVLKETYFRGQDEVVFDWIAYNFINTLLGFPDGTVKRKDHGIPSGSYFTQIVGTLANVYMSFATLASMSGKSSVHEMITHVEIRTLRMSRGGGPLAMGDDNLTWLGNRVDEPWLKSYCAYLTRTFGVETNPAKCDQGGYLDPPVFLKREWRDLGEWRDPLDLWINVIHPEHDRSYEDYSPWSIIYGLYLTYAAAFPRHVTESWILDKLYNDPLGLEQLQRIDRQGMPGVFRGLGEDPNSLLYKRAKHQMAGLHSRMKKCA